MKKSALLTLTITICLMLFSGVVLAATDDLPSPGITPDSPFYFLDGWGESISMFFTLSDEAKIEKKLGLAEEKLAETKKIADEGKTDATEVAEKNYEKDIDDATDNAKKVSDATGKEKALQKIQEATTRHQAVIQKVLSKVPEQAKAAIERAIEKSATGRQNAIDAINKNKRGKANNSKSENTGSNSNQNQ